MNFNICVFIRSNSLVQIMFRLYVQTISGCVVFTCVKQFFSYTPYVRSVTWHPLYCIVYSSSSITLTASLISSKTSMDCYWKRFETDCYSLRWSGPWAVVFVGNLAEPHSHPKYSCPRAWSPEHMGDTYPYSLITNISLSSIGRALD